MAVRQDIKVGLIAFVGLVGSMILLIAVWGVEAWFAYEVSVLNEDRYEIDRNVAWLDLRDEQYANIADAVGNTTTYAAADAYTSEAADVPAAGERAPDYRYASEQRDVAIIPIHAAMAQLAAQHAGQQVSVDQMRDIDREFSAIVNEAYADYMTLGLADEHGTDNHGTVPPPSAQSPAAATQPSGGAGTRPAGTH